MSVHLQGLSECSPKCWFHSSKGFDYHITFVPWLRSWCRDSNYLPVSPLKRRKGSGGGHDDDDAAAADKSGERWMDRICMAIRLREMMPNKTDSLGITAAGTSNVFIFFSAWADFHILQRWHLFHLQYRKNISANPRKYITLHWVWLLERVIFSSFIPFFWNYLPLGGCTFTT